MKIIEFITGKAQEEGVELDEADLAAFSQQPPEGVSQTQWDQLKAIVDKREQENADLKAETERQAATFARMETEKRHADAVSFARTLIEAKRLTPGSAEAFAALAERIAAADAVATFAEGETATSGLLKAFAESLPDLSIFTTDAIRPEAAAALFNAEHTEGVTTDEAAAAERVKKLLAATPYGRQILAEKQSPAKAG